MDGEQLQFLGFLGIFKESFKLIFKWRKIFTKITFAFILPLILVEVGFSIFLPIPHNTQLGSPTYNDISDSISWESTFYWLIFVTYLFFSVIFSLLSVSSVVYTVACVYNTDKEITFKEVISVIPKVWKSLVITSLCLFCIMFAYCMIFMIFVVLLFGTIIFSNFYKTHTLVSPDTRLLETDISYTSAGWLGGLPIPIIICMISFMIWIIYVSLIWQLANVISVLEKKHGIQAMAKSKELIKGKMGTSLGIFSVWIVCSVINYFLYKQTKVNYESFGFGERILYMILTVVWWTFIYLLNLVVQTVLYLVCKSSLADHLEGYYGEYLPLNSKAAQLEDINV